jgi:hypothetical protein
VQQGGQLRQIDEFVFSGCFSLFSLFFPCSVERLGAACFAQCSNLATASFEPDSRLCGLERFVFAGCHSLRTLSIPNRSASVNFLSGALPVLEKICLDHADGFFRLSGDFLFESDTDRIVTLLNGREDVILPNTVRIVGKFCFKDHLSFSSVAFEPGSRVSVIEARAFAGCEALESICFPASLEVICVECFHRLHRLRVVSFKAGSKLSALGERAFRAIGSCRRFAFLRRLR